MDRRFDSVWGRVETIRQGRRDADWESAWAYLLSRYRPGIEAKARYCLTRMAGSAFARQEAGEATAAFLAWLAERDHVQSADPERASFRTWIHHLLFRFVRDWYEKHPRAKPWPKGKAPVSLYALEVGDPPTHEAADDTSLAWTRCVLEGALARVQGRSERNATLLHALARDTPLSDGDLAVLIDVPRARVPVIRFKARKMLAEEVWRELKESVKDGEALDEERIALMPYLGDLLDAEAQGSFFGRRPPTA